MAKVSKIWADKDASKYLDYLRQLEELEAMQ